METQLKILSYSDNQTRWDEFVSTHEDGSIYHISLWQELLRETFGCESFYLAIEDGNHKIVAGMPVTLVQSKITGRRLESLPCAQYCNPLISDKEQCAAFILFMENYIKEHRIKYAELRLSDEFFQVNQPSDQSVQDHCVHLLNLERTLDDIRRSFHKSVRRGIDKAHKDGLDLVVGATINDVRQLYRLYLQMRKDHGLIPFPYKFFANMWTLLAARGYIEVLHAAYQGGIISSMLLLKYNDTVIYEYGASISAMMRYRPSHFLLWEAIKRAHAQGYRKFDFGRTHKKNEGLFGFKEKWGAEQHDLHYVYYPSSFGVPSLREKKLAKKIMYYTVRCLPKSLCQVMGHIIYKRII